MFIHGHAFYSLARVSEATDSQLVGSILPDAALVSAFSWQDLHDPVRVDNYAQHMTDDTTLDHVLDGIRHHIELDERAHASWRDRGGYAYTKQTPELKHAVQAALSIDGDVVATVAHNIIETACDVLLLQHSADIAARLQDAIAGFDVELAATSLGRWLNVEPDEMSSRLNAFFDIWKRHEFSHIDGMVGVWAELVEYANSSNTYGREVGPFDQNEGRRCLELAIGLVAGDFLEVLTP